METMKRSWVSPVSGVQQFTPQEFVAACAHPEYWTAQCCEFKDKGYVFFDYNENDIIDDADRETEGNHGGCHRTHPFPWVPGQGFPTYNAWVLKASIAHGYMFESGYAGDGQILKEDYANDTYLVRALVKRPGEALDGNWLVCYDLASVHHPS